MSESERRRDRRVATHLNILASNACTGEKLGSLANLSVSGFLLVGQKSLPVEQTLAIVLQPSDPALDSLTVDVDCLWVDQHTGGAVWSGAQFVNVSPSQIIAIAELVAAFSGPEAI